MAVRKLVLHTLMLFSMIGFAMHATAQFTRSASSGAFPDPLLIESHLHRGVSTQNDVQRLLGVPSGLGRTEMAFPPSRQAEVPIGSGPRDVWYYDDIEISTMKAGGNTLDMKERQQILLIFFKAGIFDGYLWTSNALTSTARQ
ncbi:conserved exported protein of unknown function [Burkholderia multivorans]